MMPDLTNRRFCYGLLPSEMDDPFIKEVTPIIIVEDEKGYWQTDWKWKKEHARDALNLQNAKLGIDPKLADFLMARSMASPAVFTPSLEAARDDLFKYIDTNCYIAIGPGYWARGVSPGHAARMARKEGGISKDKVSIYLVLGDKTAEVNEGARIITEAGAHVERVTGSTLGHLASLE